MFPLPVNCQLSYSNLCWNHYLKITMCKYCSHWAGCQGWIGSVSGLVLCVWIGTGVAVSWYHVVSEQRRRSWENCLEDEWFCCIWFVNVITIFWWESTCRFFFKTQPSKMIYFRFKEKRRVKAEAGWFRILTVLAFYPWWIPVMR